MIHFLVRQTGLYKFHWAACGKVINRDTNKKTKFTPSADKVTCPKCLQKMAKKHKL